MKIIVLFVEVTEYNLALIEQVYERLPQHWFTYVFCARSVTGHETARQLPEHATVLQGALRDRVRALSTVTTDLKADFAIINGYTGRVNAWLIQYCRRHGIPYAIESDTQLNIPANPVKRLFKQAYLHRIFQGNAYGFPGGTRQIELFRHYGMPEDRIFVMPMTVDTARFREIAEQHSQEEYKETLGLSGHKVILYAGRFAPEKNLPCLLRAAALLRRSHEDFLLCLIGKGESRPELERLAEELGLRDRVRFYEYQLMPRLAEFYSAADVFVLPSSFEPWGLVVNEALACRVPVIASDAVGCADDLIVPGENGDVFPSGNPDALYLRLEKWMYEESACFRGVDVFQWNHDKYRAALTVALTVVERAKKSSDL